MAGKKKPDHRSLSRFWSKRTEQFLPWVRALGMDTLWQIMSLQSRREALGSKLPNPELEIHLPDGQAMDPKVIAVGVWNRLSEQQLLFDEMDVPLAEVFTVLPPLTGALIAAGKRARSRLGADTLAKLDALPAVAERMIMSASTALPFAIGQSMVPRSRVDRLLVQLRAEYYTGENGKPRMKLVIDCVPPQRRTFTTGDQKRYGYRLAVCSRWHAIDWISCTAGQLGLKGDSAYPVYILSHALDRVEERMRIGLMDPEEPTCAYLLGAFNRFACDAVTNPRITRTDDGTLLFEYRFAEHKLGYLVADLVDNAILIRTFLLLTMQGTPEAAMLYERCRLDRRSIEWLYLDSLNAIFGSDLADDSDLQQLLSECGCESLLEFARTHPCHSKGMAEECRKFLMLDQRKLPKVSLPAGKPEPR